MKTRILLIGLIFTLLLPAQLNALSTEEALHILGAEVLLPSSSSEYITAVMLPAPLSTGIVEPGSGGPPTVDIGAFAGGNPQWVAVVDSFPTASFSHAATYVFIDDVTGAVNTFRASWWPNIDGVRLGDNASPGNYPILIYCLIPRPYEFGPGPPHIAPMADYGDAPDGQYAYFGIMGAFPTLYATTNSVLGRPGAHALTTGFEMLGTTVSKEVDADDTQDPDGVPNFRDADSDERMFVSWNPNTSPPSSHLIYDVTISPVAPEGSRYVNALFDFDQSGDWGGSANGTEWGIVNQMINIPSGLTSTQISPQFDWGTTNPVPTHIWIRVALTRTPIDPLIFGSDGWDGSGAFAFGEIEDFGFYLCFSNPRPKDPPDPQPRPPQPHGPGGFVDPGGGAGPRPSGPQIGYCGRELKYYALVVQGNDNTGQTMVREAAENMENLLGQQGYSTTRLTGANSTKAKIGDWIDQVLTQVLCEDRIFIYFIAHGDSMPPNAGYFELGSLEWMSGPELDAELGKIWPCPGEHCLTPEVCCDMTVLIESCFSGKWMLDLPATGRRIITTSSATQPSWGADDGHGCEYSDRYAECARDSSAADANGDGNIDPTEAHDCAAGRLITPKTQTPDIDDRTCDCVRPPKFKIIKVHDAVPGGITFVPLIVQYEIQMGGFDFLIAYNALTLTFLHAEFGQLPVDCEWEYFTYRFAANPECEPDCSALVRLTAIADINNGMVHPSCFGPPDLEPHELATMQFLVNEETGLPCEHMPIKFFWLTCEDNVVSSVDGQTWYVDQIIHDFNGNLIWDEEDDDQFPEYSRPDYIGTPDACLTGGEPEDPEMVRLANFWQGGINTECCNCGEEFGDISCDNAVNPIDVVRIVNYVYKSHDARCYPDGWDCPHLLGDVNCDTGVNPVDVVLYVNYVYKNITPFPCGGCE